MGAADIERIIGFMVPEEAGVLGTSLRRHVAHRGWERLLPRLIGSKISWTRGSTVAEVLHTYDGGPGRGLLEVHWEYRAPEWWVRGIRFPRLPAGPSPPRRTPARLARIIRPPDVGGGCS